MENDLKSDNEILRQKAEEILKKKSSKSGLKLSEEEIHELIHQLEVHKIEFELLNKELVLAKEQIAEFAAIEKATDGVSEFAENIINTVREPLLALDQDLRVVKASRSFYNFFKVTAGETIGKLIYDLGDNQWDIPKLRELLETILPEKTTFDDYEVEHDFSTIGKRVMLLNARQIKRAFGKEKIILLAIEDITERKLVEESLSEKSRMTSEYLDILLDHAHAPIIIWDSSLVIKRFNHEFEKLSGYNSTEVIDQKIDILFPEDKIDSTLELLNNHLSDEKLEVIELDILTKDKDIRTVLWNSAHILDKEGKSTVATIAQDITRRKRTEEALQISEEKYRSIFENILDVYFVASIDGTILEASPSIDIASKGQYHRDELIGKSMYDFYPNTEERQALLEALLERGSVSDSEITIMNRDGSHVPCSISAKIQFDVHNKPFRIIGSIRDITERKWADVALQASKDFLDEIINSIASPVFVKDDKHKFCLVNNALCSLLELTRGKLIGFTGWEYFPAKQFEIFMAKDQEVFKTGKENINEEFITDGQGKIRTIITRKTLYTDLAGNKFLVGIINDITERKLAEAEQERLLYIMESSLNEIYVFDSVTLIFDYVNQGALRNLGYTREAMRGMTPLDLKPEFTEESFRQTILPLLRHEQEQLFFNTVHRRADGSLYPVEVHLQLVELEGQRVFLAMILDITERKLAEEEQRKAQRLLSISQRLAHIGSWETEISTGKLSWSDEMYRILGFPAVSPMYLDLALSVFPPDELVRFNQAIASALQGDVPYNIDYTIIRHDGQVRIIHDEGEVIRDEHGQAIWMFGTTQDITERRHAEDALRESEAKQGKMVANIGDVIVIIDQNGINRYKSPNIEKWFGWRPEEVIGFSAWENIHPDELNSVQKIFGALLGEPNATGTTECRYRCKDGSYKWIEFTGANLLHDPDIRGILGNYHDITERKQADEKLRHVARLYALLSQINQAIVRIPEQDELFRTICQVAIEFGQFRMAWVGLTDEANDRIIPVAHAGQEDGYLDMIHISTEDVPTGRGPTGSAFREGKIMTSNDIATDPWMLPWRDEALNRGYRSSAAVLLSRNGKPVGTFTLYAPEPGFFTAEEQKLLQEIGEDISYALDAMDSEIDRKQSELKLQGKNEEFKIQNEELIIAKEHAEESDRLKSAFLANMSHEVRTPLNSIIGFSELLADSDFEKEQKDEFIQHIITSGNNLLSIISDIMDISKMESGEITIRNKQINVRKFISTVKEKFSSQAENKKLELKLTLPDNDEETAVFADSDRLRQVFNNLMSNAIKFTANGSIEIGYHSMGTMVKFYVKDTGIGIPAEYHKVIFERFRQVEAEKTRKFGGNGLGLAITKNLVELMGGEIWIESESGKGSTFYFTIPCNRYPELKS